MDFPKYSGKDTVSRLITGPTMKICDASGNRCGYHKNQHHRSADEDFETGDIGQTDEDGYLHIADRKKDVIAHPEDWIFPSKIKGNLWKSLEIKDAVGMLYDAYEIIEYI